MTPSNCPSCGAALVFHSTISLLAVCSYCRSAALRKDLNLENLGRIADLKKEDSLIQLGTRGEYKKVSFHVIGRIQMRYESGYWSEWYCSFNDGTYGWLADASGNWAFSFAVDPKQDLPTEEHLRPGLELDIQKIHFTVTNIEDATYASFDGELPFQVPLGETATLADLSSSTNRFGTLDYSDEPCQLYLGEYVPMEQLNFQNLRSTETW